MNTVTPHEYIAELQKHTKTTVDVRTPMEVRSESISCSLNLNSTECTPERLSAALEAQNIEKGSKVFLLCQSGARADQVINKMGASFPWTLVKIEGGLNALKQAGVSAKATCSTAMSLERQVRITAGTLVVLGVVFAQLWHPAFIYLSGFVGAGLVFAGITNTCGMGLMLAKMPWNNR